jgi:hypothetical protein
VALPLPELRNASEPRDVDERLVDVLRLVVDALRLADDG